MFLDATQSVLLADSVECASNEILNLLRVIGLDYLVDHVAVQDDDDVFVSKVYSNLLPKFVLVLLVGSFVDYASYLVLKIFLMTAALLLVDFGTDYGYIDASVLNLHLE